MKDEDTAEFLCIVRRLTSLKDPRRGSGAVVRSSREADFAVWLHCPIIVLRFAAPRHPRPGFNAQTHTENVLDGGIIAVQRTPLGLEEKDLPLSEEGNVAARGQRAALIAATAVVPR